MNVLLVKAGQSYAQTAIIGASGVDLTKNCRTLSPIDMLLSLDFLQFQSELRLKVDAGQKRVFDPIRKKNLVLTPEELLRQLALQYLLKGKAYPSSRIRTEMGIQVNGMPRRCDILVFDAQLKPWLLVECKSPKVTLSQAVLEQAARYILSLGVQYLCITNGLQTCCCALDSEAGTFSFLDDFPAYPGLG
jgi:hypothetical protein